MILVAWLPLHHSHYKLKAALTRVKSLFKCLLIRHSKGRGGVPHALQLMSVGEQNLKVKTQSTNTEWFVANENRGASPLNSDYQSPTTECHVRCIYFLLRYCFRDHRLLSFLIILVTLASTVRHISTVVSEVSLWKYLPWKRIINLWLITFICSGCAMLMRYSSDIFGKHDSPVWSSPSLTCIIHNMWHHCLYHLVG